MLSIGLAVHARQGTLFMADDDGYVYELSLKSKSDVRNRWHVGKEIVHVIGLSVDWLFDRLYLLIENAEGTSWQISRCKLDGRESTYVVTDITYKPSHFEVDPFNGYEKIKLYFIYFPWNFEHFFLLTVLTTPFFCTYLTLTFDFGRERKKFLK